MAGRDKGECNHLKMTGFEWRINKTCPSANISLYLIGFGRSTSVVGTTARCLASLFSVALGVAGLIFTFDSRELHCESTSRSIMDALLANYPVWSDSDSESDSVPAAPVVAPNLGYVREAGEEEDLSSDVSRSPSEATESHESESDNESQSESAKDESERENVSQPASEEEGHSHSHSHSESQPESKEEGHSHSHSHSDNDSDNDSDSQPGSKRPRITSSPESAGPVGAASWRSEPRPLEATIDSSSNRPRRGYAIREESLPSAMRTFMKSLKWFWTREHNLERRGPPVCQATYEKTRERILCKYFPLSFSSLSLCLSVCLR